MERPATAVVFLTHQFSPAIARRFERLWRETAGEADCHVLLHDDGGPVRAGWTAYLQALGASHALQPFQPDELAASLGITLFGGKGLLGNVHLPLLRFARSAPYARFWQIESDVEYRGSWRDFLRAFDDCDASLLVSHLHTYAQHPEWYWWLSASAPGHLRLPQSAWRKGFFPVSRFDRRALDVIAAAHRAGWHAHFEALIPTALAQAGISMLDLRSHRPCYEGDSQDPHPRPGVQSTIRWRPDVTPGEFMTRGSGPLLFHPVKQEWWFDGARVARAAGDQCLPDAGTPDISLSV